MAQEIIPAPNSLPGAIVAHFKAKKAAWLKSEVVDYRSQTSPLWNGTVHTYRLSGVAWPTKVYAFVMVSSDGKPQWQVRPDFPRCASPLDAVKAALLERRSTDTSLPFSE